VRRPAAPISLLVAALAACTGASQVAECPGVEVGSLHVVGARTAAACLGDTAPADGSAACAALTPPLTVDCQTARPIPACCFDNLFAPSIAFTGTLSYAVDGDLAALCTGRSQATPYLGTHASAAGGDQIAVSVDTAGAVLGSCAATCAVTVHHAVTGLVARDPVTGVITGFTGEHVETTGLLSPLASCAPCGASCTATWTLSLAP